jgi:alpha-tubulin suppressor-like RCC1 family protein
MKTVRPLSFLVSLLVPFSAQAAPLSWGQNDHGQLGDRTETNHGIPAAVYKSGALAGKKVVDIAGGEVHSMALTSDGRVYGWGYNLFGQVGDGTTTDRAEPVAVNMNGAMAGKTVTAIAAGVHQCMALTSDGKLYSWGINDGGVLGDGTTTPRNAPVAVNMNGTLAGKIVTAISQGEIHCMALTSEGRVYAWGSNFYNQLGDGTSSNRGAPVAVNSSGVLSGKTVVAINNGRFHSLALTSDGRLYAWGRNEEGQLGDGSTTNRNVPVAVNMTGALAGKTIIAMDGGFNQTLALASDGKLYAWGANDRGQLGDGTTTDRTLPVAVNMSGVLAGKTVVDIRTRRDHCLALTSDGKLCAWGYNSVGQLGDGTTTTRTSPVLITLPGRTVTAIDAGSRHSLIETIAPEIIVEHPAGTNLNDGSSAVAFGSVALGSSATRIFTIKNSGPDPLIITGTNIDGPHSADYLLTVAPPSSIPAGGTASFTVRFTPDAATLRSAALHILSDDSDESPFDIALNGIGLPVPEIAVHDGPGTGSPELVNGSPAVIQFPVSRQGSPVDRGITIANPGTASLQISALTLPPGFSLVSPPSFPAGVAPGASLTFRIQLDASMPGTFAGNVVIASNDEDEDTFAFAVSGTVITPEIVILDGALPTSPELLDSQAIPVNFGVTRQSTTVTRSLLILNSGTDRLLLTGMTVPTGYTVLNAPLFPAPVEIGGSLSVDIRLDAAAPGTFPGTAAITSDDFDEATFDIPLTATVVTPEITVHDGTSAGPELTDGQAASVNFGRNIQGTPATRAFTISNTGTDPLLVGEVTAPAGYTLLNLPSLPAAIGIGQTLTFQVTLSTLTVGLYSGSVIISSDDLDEASFDFPITGEVFIPDPVATVPAAATVLNRQTGLREQTIHIANDTTATVPAYNLIIRGLPAGVEINNASTRREDGSWIVYVRQPLNPQGSHDILLEYFSANRLPVEFTPQVTTEVVLNPPDLTVPAGAAGFAIDLVKPLPAGGVLIEFPTTPGRAYQVQYSNDGLAWQTSLPSIHAAASRTQWQDRGLPRTATHPSTHPARLYRVAELAP